MSMKILVIDDEPTVCKSCEKLLKEDYDLTTILSGQEGLERSLQEDFDLILVDLKMPDMDGMEIVRAVKREKPNTEVIIMTGYSTVQSAVEGMKLGAADFVSKPFTPDEMLTAVEKALEKRKSNIPPTAVINREAIAEILNRAAEDGEFNANVSDLGADAFKDYNLSDAEMDALTSVIAPSEEAIRVVSHELKSPLATIASLARAIQEPNVPGDQKDKFLNRIIYRSEGALGMIEEYLTMSKISAGEIELELKKVNLINEVIQKALDDQKEAMEERGMKGSIDIPENLEIMCDPGYMKIVYSNLISNAAKYGAANTEILLDYVGERDNHLYLSVANVGEWIKPEDRRRIFEKYVTLGRRGTGVGLHTTMRIIKQHGGDIWVEPCYFARGICIAAESVIEETISSESSSDKLTRGNNFVFRLPLRNAAPQGNSGI